jgi:hypothetical protein
MVKTKDSPIRFQPVAKEERQQLSRRGKEVQTSREQRRTLEAQAVSTTDRKPGAVNEPARVQAPRSPIVAKQANQLAKNQAPPKAQRAPKPDLKVQPKPMKKESKQKPSSPPGKPVEVPPPSSGSP